MLEGDDRKTKGLIEKATADLTRSDRLLEYLRINCLHLALPRITKQFEQLHRDSQRANLPFRFTGDHDESPNEERVQLRAQQSLTGVVNRTYRSPFEDGPPHSDSQVWETGGELVATQSITGHVYFTVTPRKSDRSIPEKTELIIMGPLDPCNVSESRVRKVVARYLLLLKASSNIGWDSLSMREWLAYQWMHMVELRARQDLMRAGIKFVRSESLRAFVGGAFTALAAAWLTYVGLKST